MLLQNKENSFTKIKSNQGQGQCTIAVYHLSSSLPILEFSGYHCIFTTQIL